jgi:hypothetical protein
MNANRIIYFIVALGFIIAALLGGFAEYGLRWGIKPCPSVVYKDSTTQAKPDTARFDSVKIRDSIRIIPWHLPPTHDTTHDTVTIAVPMPDTGKAFDLDTTMKDGARIGVNVRAKLIIPPVEASIFYTAPPDTHKTATITITEYKTKADWKMVAIGAALGIIGGVVLDRKLK